MNTRIINVLAGIALFTGATSAQARPLTAGNAETIAFSDMSGIAYYVDRADGAHLVATLGSTGATPIRFEAILGEGQSAMISVPGAVGAPSRVITFTRSSGQLEISGMADLTMAANH